MSDYPPNVALARLYERTSQFGNIYLAGYMGLARVAVKKTGELDNDGNPIWHLVASEAPQRAPSQAASSEGAGQEETEARQAASNATPRRGGRKRDWQRPDRTTNPSAGTAGTEAETTPTEFEDLIPF